MTMMTVTNNSRANRGIWSDGELKWIKPGASITCSMSDVEVAREKDPLVVLEVAASQADA